MLGMPPIQILLLLFLVVVTCQTTTGEDLIWFPKPITNKKDALEYNKDNVATIAKCHLWDEDFSSTLWIEVGEYSLQQMLPDVALPKRFVLIFNKRPKTSWRPLYRTVQGQEARIYIEYNVADGISPAQPCDNSWDMYYHPAPQFKYTIFSFSEVEHKGPGYTKKMFNGMMDAFEWKVSTKNQWLKLNAYHVKNMKGFKVTRSKFRFLRDKLIIYQNYSSKDIFQEDVLVNLSGFEPEDIIWDNVQSKNPPKTTITTRRPKKGDGNYCVPIRALVWFYSGFVYFLNTLQINN